MGIASSLAKAAITAAVPAAGIPLAMVGWAKSAGAFVIANPAACALVLSAGVIVWQHHEICARDAKLAAHDRAAATRDAVWAHDFALEHNTVAVYQRNNATLLNAIGSENATIEHLAAMSRARQIAATAALNAARGRVRDLTALSAALRADETVHGPAGACDESDALADGRKKL